MSPRVLMMLTGGVLTPFTARLAERFGARTLIATGLICMTAGLAVISLMPGSAPVAVLSVLMTLTGLAGPLVMPPVMALLLDSVPARRAGIASGVLNTSRQVGGALAIALFGALLADRSTVLHGLRISSPTDRRTSHANLVVVQHTGGRRKDSLATRIATLSKVRPPCRPTFSCDLTASLTDSMS